MHRESPAMKINVSGTKKSATLGVAVTHEGGYGRSNYPLPHVVQGRTRPANRIQTPDLRDLGTV